MIDSTYEDKLYQTPTFAGAVRKLQTNKLRNTVMSRLRRVARMCSRTVSGTAYRFRQGSTLCSPTEEKILCRSSFRSGRRSLVCVRLSNKGKVGVQRGRETVGVPSFLPPRRAPRRSRRSQTANPPAEVQQKTPRPLGANTLTQFEYPAQPVQRKEPPRQGEHACGSSSASLGRCRKSGKSRKNFPARKDRRTPILTLRERLFG